MGYLQLNSQTFMILQNSLLNIPYLLSLLENSCVCILRLNNFPICYKSRKLNVAEWNYSTTKCEGLRMIFSVKKYRHYLLANKFVLFTDHQALSYLVNKPCNTGRIVRWFLIIPLNLTSQW